MNVKLTVRQNQMLITPWVPALEKTCTVVLTQKKFFYDPKDPRPVTFTPIPMYTKISDEGGIIFTGLLDRVKRALAKEQCVVTVEDQRVKPQGTVPSLPAGQNYRPGQQDLIHAVLNSCNGICQAPPAFGKSFCISQICKVLSKEKILVVTTRKTVVNMLFSRLKEALPDRNVRLCDGTRAFDERCDIVVCTSRALHKIPTEWPAVLLFDEVHGAAGALVGRTLAAYQNTRFYGFSATPTGRGDNGDKIVEALFGPVLYRMDYAQAVENKNVTKTQVRMVPIHGASLDFRDNTAMNRYGYWRNTQRNKKIASVVEALELEGFGKILILVNTAEHAFNLRLFLPKFQVVHAGLSVEKFNEFKKQGLLTAADAPTVDVDKLAEEFKTAKDLGIISTSKWREGVDFPDLSVVIRADGLTGSIPSIQIGGRSARIFEGKKEALVVDFEDHFGPDLLGRSMKRITNYKNEGWDVTTWNV